MFRETIYTKPQREENRGAMNPPTIGQLHNDRPNALCPYPRRPSDCECTWMVLLYSLAAIARTAKGFQAIAASSRAVSAARRRGIPRQVEMELLWSTRLTWDFLSSKWTSGKLETLSCLLGGRASHGKGKCTFNDGAQHAFVTETTFCSRRLHSASSARCVRCFGDNRYPCSSAGAFRTTSLSLHVAPMKSVKVGMGSFPSTAKDVDARAY